MRQPAGLHQALLDLPREIRLWVLDRISEVGLLEAEVQRLQRASAIVDERDRQDAKWGPQEHTLPEWIVILMEEVGELAAAALCHQFGNDDHPELDWRKEAIQVAAVALAMTEQVQEKRGE